MIEVDVEANRIHYLVEAVLTEPLLVSEKSKIPNLTQSKLSEVSIAVLSITTILFVAFFTFLALVGTGQGQSDGSEDIWIKPNATELPPFSP